jgi:DUF1365 family protein
MYDGVVRHRHLGTVPHEFETAVHMVLLDLAEVDEVLAATPGWSSGRWSPVQFRPTDYFDGASGDLALGVVDLVEERLGRRPGGRVRMLTQLRVLGWLFNPLTVYWCDDEHCEPDAVVLEVTNTPWHERHWYVLDVRPPAPTGSVAMRTTERCPLSPAPFPKQLHVSPFLPMDLDYRLTTAPPGDEVELRLELRRLDDVVFEADLRLHRLEITPASARAARWRHGWSTLKVSAAIRFQAARLWSKRARVHSHPARARVPV